MAGATQNDDIEFPTRREGESMDDFMARVGANSNAYTDLTPEELTSLEEEGFVGSVTDAEGNITSVYMEGGGPSDTGSYDEEPPVSTNATNGITNTSGSPTPMDIQDRTRNSNTVTNNELSEANAQAASSTARSLGTSVTGTPNRTSAGRSPSDAEWQQFYPKVQGRHNLLHDLNTYNYIISLTSLSKDQMADPSTYKGKVFDSEADDFFIVARTGGYQRTTQNQAGESFEYKQGSAKGDLFIENLTFDTRIGVNDMGNSNLTRGSFEVIEPHSVGTFYEELWAASRFANHENYIQAPFLLTISFLGRKPDQDQAIRPDKTTRHLPVMITGSEMSVDEGGAKYNVQFMGYNSIGAGLTRSSLWADIEPTVNPNGESVEAILMSTFYKNTLAYKDVLLKIKEGLTEEQSSEIEAKIGDVQIQNQALAGGTSNVGAWLENEYYVWFADGYAGQFPRTAEELSAKKAAWNAHVERLIGQSVPPSTQTQSLEPPTFTNTFGQAGLNDATTPTANINIVPYETALESANEEKRQAEQAVSRQRGLIQTQLQIIEARRETLARLEQASRGDPKETLETDLVQDLTVSSESKVDEILAAVERAKNQATSQADAILASQATGGSGADYVPAAGANLDATEVAQVVLIRQQIQNAQDAIVNATNELKNAETRLENANQTLEDVRTRAAEGYNLGASGVKWSFRKGASLFGIIDTMIVNSQKMEMFQDDTQLNNMANSEYIPWYKTEIIPNIIGFDVATMNFVYEFHYIITPYSIHYSKLPGVNIIFSTERLKELAVREYNYIFTGKNIDVLKFDIKYNNLFQTPLLLSPPSESALQAQANKQQVVNSNIPQSSYSEAVENLSNRISNKLGTTGFTPAQAVEKLNYRDLEVTNRSHIGIALKEFLYNPPAELALIRADVEIIGDPVYIVGSGITERPNLSVYDILTPEGEVNGFTREPDVLFNFRYPEDIPSRSDLENPNGIRTQKLKPGAYNGVYQVLGVENRFADGAFTQTLQLLRRKNQIQDYAVDERFKTEGIDFDTNT